MNLSKYGLPQGTLEEQLEEVVTATAQKNVDNLLILLKAPSDVVAGEAATALATLNATEAIDPLLKLIFSKQGIPPGGGEGWIYRKNALNSIKLAIGVLIGADLSKTPANTPEGIAEIQKQVTLFNEKKK